jgi:hypothetical protein
MTATQPRPAVRRAEERQACSDANGAHLGLSASQARQLLLADVEQDARHQAGLSRRRSRPDQARAERRARNILGRDAATAARHASDTTTT